MSAMVCRCGYDLPTDWPPAAIEHADQPGVFTILWNLYLCAPCARADRIAP